MLQALDGFGETYDATSRAIAAHVRFWWLRRGYFSCGSIRGDGTVVYRVS